MKWDSHACPPEVSPDCPGHEGWQRFASCLVEALYVNDADDQTGTVDAFGHWVGLYLSEQAEVLRIGDGIAVTVPAGTYGVLTEDDQGRMSWQTYHTAQAAQDAFDEWERRYGLWCEVEEAREAEIMITSGRVGW